MPGSNPDVKNSETPRRSRRRRDRVTFRVVPQEDSTGEQLFVVVAPTGVALYTFTDIRDATTEAAELNAAIRA